MITGKHDQHCAQAGGLLARGAGRHVGAAAGGRSSPRSTNRSQLPAASASAEEPIAAIGLESRDIHTGWQLEALPDLSRSRIDPAQLALVAFPGAVPEFAVDPRYPGDETVRLDRAKNRTCLWIDLVDLSLPILPDPECSFRPRQPGVSAAAGCRNRVQDAAALRIDFLDAILGN